MKKYMISLERKDRRKTYRYFRFECEAADFYKALEIAKLTTERLKLQIDISYEIVNIKKI